MFPFLFLRFLAATVTTICFCCIVKIPVKLFAVFDSRTRGAVFAMEIFRVLTLFSFGPIDERARMLYDLFLFSDTSALTKVCQTLVVGDLCSHAALEPL